MKPSEFILSTITVETRAAEAETLANQLRGRADHLVSWARSALQTARDLREAYDNGTSIEALADGLSPYMTLPTLGDAPPGRVEPSHSPDARKTRSDAGKPRGPRKVSEKDPPVDASVRKAVGLKNLLDALESGPTTASGLAVRLGISTDVIDKILPAYLQDEVPKIATWWGQREGDSAKVVLWGRTEQLATWTDVLP